MASFYEFIQNWPDIDLVDKNKAQKEFQRLIPSLADMVVEEALSAPREELGDPARFIGAFKENLSKRDVSRSRPVIYPVIEPVQSSSSQEDPRLEGIHRDWPYLDKRESLYRAQKAWSRSKDSDNIKLKALENYRVSYLRGEEGQFPRFISSILDDPDLVEEYASRREVPEDVYETFRIAYEAYPDFSHKERQSRPNLFSWLRSVPEDKRIDFWFACRAYDKECRESDYRFVESWWNFLDRWEDVGRDIEARLVMAGPLMDAVRVAGLDPGNHLVRAIPDSAQFGAIKKWDLGKTIRYAFRIASELWSQNNVGQPPVVDVESYVISLLNAKKLLTSLPKQLRIKKDVGANTVYPGGRKDSGAD